MPVTLTPRRLALRLLPAIAVGSIVAFAFVAFFTSALHDPEPNRVQVAVVAPQRAASAVAAQLEQAVPGAFDVQRFAREGAARRALLDQDVDGVFQPGAHPRLVLTGARGANLTMALRTAFGMAAAAQGQRLRVDDLAPLPVHDVRGLSAFFTVAGTTVGALGFAAGLFFLGGHAGHARIRLRLGLIALFALTIGLVVALDTEVVVDGLSGSFLGVAGVVALFAGTIALATTAVIRWIGAAGLSLSFIAFMLFSLPASGGAVGPEFVPDFYRDVAPALPSHAALQALRSVVYLHGDGIWSALSVLLIWAAGALALHALAWAVGRQATHPPVIGAPLDVVQAATA